VGLAALAALVAAAVIGSESSGPGARTSSPTASSSRATALPVSPVAVPPAPLSNQQPPPLCQNGTEIPKGAGACRQVGILPDAQASELFGWTFGVVNSYSGVFNGQYITVCAGAVLSVTDFLASGDHIPVGGGVRVSLDQGSTWQQFLAPDTQGFLHITAVNGGVLTLQREDGTTVTFDLATDTYT
jgi:hypothetical protein